MLSANKASVKEKVKNFLDSNNLSQIGQRIEMKKGANQ